MAVSHPALFGESALSTGSNGSTPLARMPEIDPVPEDFEERAAIMEFDGGMSHDEAERAAWALVLNHQRLH